MTPERFRRVEELAMLVVHRDERERTAFLAEACAGDHELRREVESLLASDEQAADFLVEPAAQRMGLASNAPQPGDDPALAAESPPAAVGRYLLERELGSGGMGLVYAAGGPAPGRKVGIQLGGPASSARRGPSPGRARLLRGGRAMARGAPPTGGASHDARAP